MIAHILKMCTGDVGPEQIEFGLVYINLSKTLVWKLFQASTAIYM